MKSGLQVLFALFLCVPGFRAAAQADGAADETPVFAMLVGLTPHQVITRLAGSERYSITETRVTHSGESYIGLIRASRLRSPANSAIENKAFDDIFVHFTPPAAQNLSYLSYRQRRFARADRPHPDHFRGEVIRQLGAPGLDARKDFQPNMKLRWFWNLDRHANLKCRTSFTSMIKRFSSTAAFDKLKNHVRISALRCPDFSYLESIEGQSAPNASYDQVIEFDVFSIDFSVLLPSDNVPGKK